MGKILMVSGLLNELGGGNMICKRNLQVLVEIIGEENVYQYRVNKLENQYKTFYGLSQRCIYNYTNGINSKVVNDILDISGRFDYIWLDNSCYGTLAKILKQHGYKGYIITFFHNIESIFQNRKWWQKILYIIYNRPIKKSEKYATEYSDLVFVLNKRDCNYLNKIYGLTNKVSILPSSINDVFINPQIITKSSNNRSLNLLFVGSNFYANINGLYWFIKNVLPYTDVRLTVVGNGMDKVSFPRSEKLIVYGFVEELTSYYQSSDAVIAPIFEGSGMKTKTTEALMWGKYIIGTPEAFCGFDVDENQGIQCQTKDDFINAIEYVRRMEIPSFVKSSRDLFLEKYSINSSVNIVKKELKEIQNIV